MKIILIRLLFIAMIISACHDDEKILPAPDAQGTTTQAISAATADTVNMADTISIVTDTLHIADSLSMADSLNLADSLQNVDSLRVADSLAVADSLHRADSVMVADSLALADSLRVADSLKVAESMNSQPDSAETREQEEITSAAKYEYAKFRDMPYRIMMPHNYDPSESYPLLLFLHGIGERGNDNNQQLRWGASLFQTDSIRKKYPAFIVFPQCKTSAYWFERWGVETLKGLVDHLAREFSIDRDKINIAGLSMGAYGTYSIVAAYPNLFASAVAISGDGNERKADAMSRTRWRIFAGGKDNVVSASKSEKMTDALKRSGARVSFTLYPNADHVESWVNALAEPDFCSWLFGT